MPLGGAAAVARRRHADVPEVDLAVGRGGSDLTEFRVVSDAVNVSALADRRGALRRPARAHVPQPDGAVAAAGTTANLGVVVSAVAVVAPQVSDSEKNRAMILRLNIGRLVDLKLATDGGAG